MDKIKLCTEILKQVKNGDTEMLEDCFQLIRDIESDAATVNGKILVEDENFKVAHEFNKKLQHLCIVLLRSGKGDEVVEDIYKRTYLFDAPYDFDSYCIYLEWNREQDKRFYLPRRKQLLPLVNSLQDLETGDLELLAISTPPGVGKALANDTPILTRNGWKNHGDLVVGDEVIGMNGKFKKVIAVHPKCMLDCLVEFTNGEKIQCHENHEWKLLDHSSKYKEYLRETKEYEKYKLESGEPNKRGHRYRWLLPFHDYVQGIYNPDLLDPYTLGAWLGDGANRNPTICGDRKDKAIIDKIISNGIQQKWYTIHKDTGVWYYDFDIRKQLQRYGMCHSRKKTPKHIPQEYLVASVQQRLELLAGLLDTDGSLSGGKKYSFTTAEVELRDDFVSLLSTFGWRACVVEYKPTISSSGIKSNRPYWNVSFTPDTAIPCALERKQNKYFPTQHHIALKSITRVEPKEGNCITVEGDGMYLAGKTMLPTHNTTIAIFYLTWIGGRNPELTILGGSHSNDFLRGVYDEIHRIVDPSDDEYLFQDVFPLATIATTNAKSMRIDLEKPKRFQTFEFSSIGSGNAGKVRASHLLYCDDLVDGIETAMSRDRLDKLYQQYYTDLRQRKIGKARELHIATRWSVHDVIGRLQEQFEDDPHCKFLSFPALNENDESNFDYPYNLGFSTEFYHQQRAIMDDVSWRALYMNVPIEREGQLYVRDELRRYFELPEVEPDAILAVCDTKTTGSDYCVLPIAYKYGKDYYIEDVVCENFAPDIVENSVVNMLLKHKPHYARFESNVAGGKMAQVVQERIKEKGCKTKITTKWTQANKETKIQVESPFVKQNFLFKDDSVIQGEGFKEYRKMLQMLCSYSLEGKNKHDDVPDALAQLSQFTQSFDTGKVVVSKRFF